MNYKNCIALAISAVFLAACGGGGGGGGDGADSKTSATKNPLGKYVGNYYACDDHELSIKRVVEYEGDGLSISLASKVYQNADCSGQVLGDVEFPGSVTVKYSGVTTAAMPPVSVLPSSDTVDKVSVSVPAMTPRLVGVGVDGLCVKYSGGDTCYEAIPVAAVADAALYLKGGYMVSFSLENGVLSADDIASTDPIFNVGKLEYKADASSVAINDAKSVISSKMRDPSSTLFQNVKVYRLGSDTTVCGEFNAKNGFGAYVGYKKFYYRPGSSGVFQFVYEVNESGSYGYVLNSATRDLIDAVCSSVSKEKADQAQATYLKAIVP